MANPVVSKLHLGLEMKRLREEAGRSREKAAEILECDLSKISRLETGKSALRTLEVRALLDLYEVPEDHRGEFEELARSARSRSTFRVPDWAQRYAGLEQASSELRTYETELVPGLMQTEGYIRAVTLAADPTRSRTEVNRLVAGRLERQEQLTQDNPPQVTAVLNEAVIRRVVGGPDVMDEQLGRLLELGKVPTVSLHALPYCAGAHAAMGSSFMLLYLPKPVDMSIVYLEDLLSADYLDQPEQIKAYSLTFERLLGAALGPRQTLKLINEVRKDLH